MGNYTDKRSGFAHSGIKKDNRSMREEDYLLLIQIFQLVVFKLLYLYETGAINCLSKSNLPNSKSLDEFIERVKYGS